VILVSILLLAIVAYIGFTQFSRPCEPAEPVTEASVSTEAEESIETAEPTIEEPEIAEAEEPRQNEVTVADLPDEELEYDYGDLGKLGDLLALMEDNDDLRNKWIDAGCPNPDEESDTGSWELFKEFVGEDPLTGEKVEIAEDKPAPTPVPVLPAQETPVNTEDNSGGYNPSQYTENTPTEEVVTPPETVASDNGVAPGAQRITFDTPEQISEASEQAAEEWYAEQGITVH